MCCKKCEGYRKEIYEAEQILGRILGYPYYCDDPKNFPDATSNDGVCTGDNTIVSLAMMIEERLKLRDEVSFSRANNGGSMKVDQFL